ncbi:MULTISPECIES: SDR family NAD(P)-dependent oxidoreductase [Streptomyces]|uniref:SDR family NAD(P)-dependent oxidoreductase n=2 Tax=Streptomyces TaxID=1883 RepID=UPI00099D37F4
MIERRWGRIMHIGSVNARAGRTNRLAYSTAKAGLLGLTRSLARELGRTGSASIVSRWASGVSRIIAGRIARYAGRSSARTRCRV